jgi:hypothetical protein
LSKKSRKLLKKHLRLRKRKLLPSKFKRSPRTSHLSRSRQLKVKSPRPNLLRRRSLPRLKQKMHHQQKKSQPLPKLNINRKSKPNRMSQRPRRLLRRHHLKSPLNRLSPRLKRLLRRHRLKSPLNRLSPRLKRLLRRHRLKNPPSPRPKRLPMKLRPKSPLTKLSPRPKRLPKKLHLKSPLNRQSPRPKKLPKKLRPKSLLTKLSPRPKRLSKKHRPKSPLSPRPKKLPKRFLLKSKLRILLLKLMPRIQPILPRPLASKRLKRTPRSKKCQKRRMKRKMSDSNL